MYSELMHTNFDKNAGSYDAYAVSQKRVAQHLTAMINDEKKEFQNIFEIGCGTGYFSRLLYNNFQPNELLLNDACHNMIDISRSKLAEYKEIGYCETDIEEYEFTKNYDLIATSSTLQWITQLKELFVKIKNSLNPEGLFAFSLYTEGTFHELQTSFRKTYEETGQEVKKHILDFYKNEELMDLAESLDLRVKRFETGKYTFYYKNPMDFLKSVKSIGASGFRTERVCVSMMRKMVRNYRALFENSKQMVPVTYQVAYGILQK